MYALGEEQIARHIASDESLAAVVVGSVKDAPPGVQVDSRLLSRTQLEPEPEPHLHRQVGPGDVLLEVNEES